jgi:hypothetical protein
MYVLAILWSCGLRHHAVWYVVIIVSGEQTVTIFKADFYPEYGGSMFFSKTLVLTYQAIQWHTSKDIMNLKSWVLAKNSTKAASARGFSDSYIKNHTMKFLHLY